MELVFTDYHDGDPIAARSQLENAVAPALDAAAARIGTTRLPEVTHPLEGGVRVCSGLGLLDGSEIRVSGEDRLVSIQVRVPWHRDGRERLLLAANAFATVVNERVGAPAAL